MKRPLPRTWHRTKRKKSLAIRCPLPPSLRVLISCEISSDEVVAMPYIITGPFLATAVLCERADRDRYGALTITRIIDGIVLPAAARQTPPTIIELTLVVIFRSGKFRGSREIALQQISPSGAVAPPTVFPTLFQGEDHGAGVIAKVSLTIQEEGLHWFEVLLGGQPITRIPLRVAYQS